MNCHPSLRKGIERRVLALSGEPVAVERHILVPLSWTRTLNHRPSGLHSLSAGLTLPILISLGFILVILVPRGGIEPPAIFRHPSKASGPFQRSKP
jgi:hypothetical protein